MPSLYSLISLYTFRLTLNESFNESNVSYRSCFLCHRYPTRIKLNSITDIQHHCSDRDYVDERDWVFTDPHGLTTSIGFRCLIPHTPALLTFYPGSRFCTYPLCMRASAVPRFFRRRALQQGMTKRMNVAKPEITALQAKMQDIKDRVRWDEPPLVVPTTCTVKRDALVALFDTVRT